MACFTDWKKQYIEPINGSRTWTMPPASQLVDDLRAFGGIPQRLIGEISTSVDAQHQLLFQILQVLSEPGNEGSLAAWKKVCMLAQLTSLRLGTDRLLADFAVGRLKNFAMIQKIASRLMPELYGDVAAPVTEAKEPKHELDQMIDDLKPDTEVE